MRLDVIWTDDIMRVMDLDKKDINRELKARYLNPLKKNNVYSITFLKRSNYTELAIFSGFGQTGLLLFHPLGEPSFQDTFSLPDVEDYKIEWVRKANKSDLGI